MKPWEKFGFGLLAAILAATGVAYFWMEYVITTDDPFAVVNHPWQPFMLHLHLLAAPAFLLLFGVIFNAHVRYKIRNGRQNRRSGLLSLITFGLMGVSGYALQVVTSEAVKQAWLVLHLASGAVFTVAYTVHLVISAVLAARARRRSSQWTVA